MASDNLLQGQIGRPVPRREDERVLRGRARYLDDLHLPGEAHVAFVRSPFARARIRSIAKPEGALLVLTADELPPGELPITTPEGAETADAPHPILARGETLYAGQPVAAVVAESRAAAEDLAELVAVDWEPLEPVVDPHDAGETLLRFARSGGDVDGAFAAAAHVVRRTFRLPRTAAAPMESRGALAFEEDGRLVAWISAQDPHRQRDTLEPALGREVEVRVPDVGGAFGSKGIASPESAATALCALALGRPVKWTEDRLENLLATYQGRGLEAEVELALGGNGRFLGLRARLLADLGAYLYSTTAIPPHTAAMLMSGCYAIPAIGVELRGVRTNKVPTGPCRGAGRPEAALFVEGIVDEAARELGLDRIELRRRNLVRSFPHETPLGWTYDSGDYERCLDRALELLGPEPEPDGRLHGSGVGLYVERAGGMWEVAEARVEPGGRIVVSSGSSPHGQGHATTFAQIAADELGVEAGRVEVRFGEAGGAGTFASRSVAMGGSAVALACRDLVGQAAGRPWEELAGLSASARFASGIVFSSGCYAARVAVDRDTGVPEVLRIAAVDDPGRVVNPLLAEGQVYGGTVHGLGECLVEEVVHDEDGSPQSVSFADYHLLTAADLPPIAPGFVETPSPLNPLGAKGIGEGGAIGVLPAVANAFAAALDRRVDPPFTERALWRALGGVGSTEPPESGGADPPKPPAPERET
ncbi:MAG TPA: xanthine dehydrogenase family protein molybdopterin-binding subunit [Gaiellaceae bacterium]|nr:xanthine dehydrogenase family protein molybdopterin-binding subunit [Gaiellaceae bacterium]